ncbi:MAG: DUF3990 domain-containing protein [Bacteroidales bacterium]|nr:DUF3990 domain-containing protein [Bacteroidales bacterium]
MARIEIFHGSGKIINKPEFGVGNPKNDYGLGFYCTKSLELAKEWASTEGCDGFANKYEIDTTSLSVLNLNSSSYNILNWLAILLDNRTFETKTPLANRAKEYLLENFLPDYKRYDIIVGYRADDSYFSFSKSFLDNGISLEQLNRAMHLGKLGQQFVIKSERAFEKIKYIESIPSENQLYYPKRSLRDIKAREEFYQMLKETPVDNAQYVIDILRDKIKEDGLRL